MSIEIQCMTEKLIVITIKLDYSKVPSKSTVPTTDCILRMLSFAISLLRFFCGIGTNYYLAADFL